MLIPARLIRALGCNINAFMFTAEQKLIFAARGRNLELAQERLLAGANPSYYDERHGAALFAAVNNQQVEMIALLMEHGASIQITDRHGHGVLEHALRTGNHKIIAAVLEYGASLKSQRAHWREALRQHFIARAV
jgi:ankyrin repeat protein